MKKKIVYLLLLRSSSSFHLFFFFLLIINESQPQNLADLDSRQPEIETPTRIQPAKPISFSSGKHCHPTSLTYAACGCHRNFHRREEDPSSLSAVVPAIEFRPHNRHQLPPPPPPVGIRSPDEDDSASPPPISSSYMLLALSGGAASAVLGFDFALEFYFDFTFGFDLC